MRRSQMLAPWGPSSISSPRASLGRTQDSMRPRRLVSATVPHDPLQGPDHRQPACLLRLLGAVTVSQTSLVFDDLDNFEEG
ncbi:unnamed protein product [Rangifer tarandus platyrhynchus]|uniref:Uncharacterized protein n=1 Tax=Rangifer tarandus platyrhynchus TaxID=3082113 RepID=A0AC59ZFF1_RANTA